MSERSSSVLAKPGPLLRIERQQLALALALLDLAIAMLQERVAA